MVPVKLRRGWARWRARFDVALLVLTLLVAVVPREAAAAVMTHARSAFGLRRLVAITSPDNEASIRLLEKLGLRFEATMNLAGDSHEVSLFAADL